MVSGRTLVRPEWTTLPVGDISAAEWGVVKDDIDSIGAGQQSVNLRSEGFALDGVTDETAAFQSLVNSVSDGTQIVLDERAELVLSAQVNVTNKSFSLVGHGNATIKAIAKLSVPLINITNCPDVRIFGLTIQGAEATFDAVFNTQAYAISLTDSPRADIGSITVKNISRGTLLTRCNGSTVTNYRFLGLLSGHVEEANYHSALQFMASHDCVATNVYGDNLGNVILAGFTTERLRCIATTGVNIYDGGIYISSGHYCEIVAPHMRTAAGYTGQLGNGCKIKGNYNSLIGGTFIGMGLGATITGFGNTPDADGYDGIGNRIIGSRAINCKVAGFQIGGGSGGWPRESILAFNHVEGGGEGYTNTAGDRVNPVGGLFIYGGINNIITGNTVSNWTGTSQAVYLTGAGTGGVNNTVFSENHIRYAGTNGQNAALWITSGNGVDFINNTFTSNSNTYAVRTLNCTNLTFTGNRRVQGPVVTLSGAYIDSGSTNIKAINNPHMTFSNLSPSMVLSGNGTGSGTANMIVTGSRGGNAALTSLLTQLASAGVITNNTTV